MPLRMVLGRSGSGKTRRCFEEIAAKLKAEPDGPPLILLTPDQMTFDAELAFTNRPDLSGMTRLDVYSFSRFALRVLERTGGAARKHLNAVGISMLLRKIIEGHKGELRVFQKAADQNGFYGLLQETLSEFKRYCLSPNDLEAAADRAGADPLLKDKLHDLKIIYAELEEALVGKYVESDDYLTLAASKIPEWTELKDAEVWVDGFESFTPQELGVLAALMKQTKRVTVTLTLDRLYEGKAPSDLTLFRRTAKTCVKLMALCREEGVETEEPVFCEGSERFRSPALAHLERHFERRPIPAGPSDGAIRIFEAANRREEIEAVAREILRLVREEGYRYRDISVLVRDLAVYRDLLESLFADYGIPVFIDQKRSMQHHPLIELIRSSLDVILQNWRYEPVFRAFKTDLMFPEGEDLRALREHVDQLENYVLAFGIHGDRWKTKEPWIYRAYRGLQEEDVPQSEAERAYQKRLNHWRWLLASPLIAFEKNMRRAKTVREKAAELYRYLEGLAVPEKIEALRDQAEREGRLDEAREHAQAWKAVLDCLDQLVEAAGDEEMSLERFRNVLETGLDALRFALVPPALDHVLVGSLDRTRAAAVRIAFIMGVNDGVLPAKPREAGLFSDEEREALEAADVELAPSGREQLLGEEYLIYRAVTAPSEKLYLTYPLASEDGTTLLPSPVIARLERFFADLPTVYVSGEPHEVPENEQADYIVPSARTIGHIARQLRRGERGYPVSELWWAAYNWFIRSPEWRDRTVRVLGSRFYENKAERLPHDVAGELYGRRIRASVSRMEMFNACPFAHFSSYGLRLKEREIYRLEAPDIGQLFHAALKLMTERLTANNRDWSDLSKEACETLATEVVEKLAPGLQRQILLSSARFHYLKRKLRDTVVRAAWTLARHAKASGFSPVGLELPFGPNEPLPPLTFQLPNGVTLEIVGRIDRVDKGESRRGLVLRIIDYKSGAKYLSLAEIYYGLALQMLAYLDVVITHAKLWLGEEAEPAGVLYFHVHNPMLNEAEKPTDDELEEKLLKAFKMKGLLLADEEVIRLMDAELQTGDSAIIPVGFKKDGTLKKYSSVASGDQFRLLRGHVREVMKKVGEAITDGVIDIAPYKMEARTPCQYCAFKPVCQFDPAQAANAYRVLKNEDDDRIYEKMAGKEEGGDRDDGTTRQAEEQPMDR